MRYPLILAGLLVALTACGGGNDAPERTGPAAPLPTVGDSAGVLSSKEAKQLFGYKRSGSQQAPAPFGSYAKGCVAGGVELPETGPTWQAMRLSRNRNWGHPEVVDFVQDLSRKAAQQPGWNGLYIGDISQPRGGPMLSGHASHQIGTDQRFRHHLLW